MLSIWPQRDPQGRFFNRSLDTDGHFAQRYGFFEIEARLPRGKGVWPAFWLLNRDGDRRIEIDVLEAYPGGGPESGWGDRALRPVMYAQTVWRSKEDQLHFNKTGTADLSAGFHRYGVKWQPARISFYFDCQEVSSVAARIDVPMYLLLTLWFGSASGTPGPDTPQGRENAFAIRYVRVWRFTQD